MNKQDTVNRRAATTTMIMKRILRGVGWRKFRIQG